MDQRSDVMPEMDVSETFALQSKAAEGKDAYNEATKLIEHCKKVDVEVTCRQAMQLIRYLDMVLKKNEVLNLTAIRDWDKALVLHVVDSLTLMKEFDDQPNGITMRPYLDMGCGAGFPGIPLSIMREKRHGVLCDSVKKKVKAVDEFIELLQLNNQLTTSDERLEILAGTHMRSFGCVVARAVASLPVLVEYAAPLLAKRGFLIVSKGIPSQEEYESGDQAAEICGLEMVSRRVFDLPEGLGQRTILTYTKAHEPTIRLPRAIGMATKQPLA